MDLEETVSIDVDPEPDEPDEPDPGEPIAVGPQPQPTWSDRFAVDHEGARERGYYKGQG